MYFSICVCVLFFFKQKTAYEMRISDWSSDVCSSDLLSRAQPSADPLPGRAARRVAPSRSGCVPRLPRFEARPRDLCPLRLFGALMLSPEEWSIVVLSLKVGGAAVLATLPLAFAIRSEEHTSELQSLMRISYAVFCLKKKIINHNT